MVSNAYYDYIQESWVIESTEDMHCNSDKVADKLCRVF